jgi:hypothetical protein
MEFVDLLYMAIMAITAMFVSISSVIFVFLQQGWSFRDMVTPSSRRRTRSPCHVAMLPCCHVVWFAFAESKFREKTIISQWRRFELLLAAMLEKVLEQVMDSMDNIPEDFPYDTLKSCLLEAHTLLDHKKLDVLFKSEPLSNQKPSQVLTSMLAYCLLPCRPCLGYWSQATSGAWQPERTGFGPLKSHSLMIWWPMFLVA